jgi:serine/threonine protein kinase
MTPESSSLATVDENARRRFEAAWRKGRPEPIEQFLPAENHPNYLATLQELVQIELEMLWRSQQQTVAQPSGGEAGSAHVEAYLARFPCLNQPAIVLRLLEQEYRVRCLYGDLPSPREYRLRFPDLVFTGREIEGTMPSQATAPNELGQIPGYQVVGFLGRGGMGVVYKARHIRLNRMVALKMISAGAGASAKELARFHTEAEAAARLQHPNIVQIYEVGECHNRPYLALEFVEGGNLAQRLAGVPQPARAAAQLVLTLACAMSVAHQRGIVHRDLKPANVLLTADSLPKITDFGLAKLLDSETGQTSTGVPMGTPSYMAPEQALGKASEISPATDIYALGAILYEMLTGRPPFRGETALSTMEQVRSQDPVPPTRLHSKVPRDLETICLKCLHKEPRRRYGSADELAADLQRFLTGESIRARPTPAWERGIKWARRRPALASLLGVSGAAVLAVLSIVLLAYAHLQRANARLEQERNDKEAARAEAQESFRQARDAVDQMLTEVGAKQLAQVPQMEPVRRALLEKALRFYQGFLQKESTDPLVQRETARAYRRVADIHSLLGRPARAEEAYREGIALQEKLTTAFPTDAGYRQDLAVSYYYRGNLLADTNRPEEAEATYRAALTIREQLVRDFPTVAAYREDLADAYHGLGSLLSDLGRHQEAEQSLHQALALLGKLPADLQGEAPCRAQVARSSNNLGLLFWKTGRHKEARLFLQQAIDLQAQLIIAFPDDWSYQFGLANGYYHLGLAFANEDPEQAAAAYAQALTHQRKLATDFPSIPDFQNQLGGILHNLAQLLYSRGDWLQTRRHLEEAIRYQRNALATNPHNPTYLQFLGNHYAVLADTLIKLGEHAEAVKAAAALARLFPDRPRDCCDAAGQLALCVQLALNDAKLPPDQRAELARTYAAEAVRMLREAFRRGYRDFQSLKEDRALESLRSRDDFQKLLQEMGAPGGPLEPSKEEPRKKKGPHPE